jgi:TrwC relaxase
VVYLHSALAKDRIQAAGRQERQTLLIYSKWDCNTGLGIAGLVKLSMLCIAAAVHAGFAYFQRQTGYTRTGSHGTRVHGRETGQWHEADLAVAHWLQHTSRDGDMQLHVHSQIGHVAKTATDGKWRAPDTELNAALGAQVVNSCVAGGAAARRDEKSGHALTAGAGRGSQPGRRVPGGGGGPAVTRSLDCGCGSCSQSCMSCPVRPCRPASATRVSVR